MTKTNTAETGFVAADQQAAANTTTPNTTTGAPAQQGTTTSNRRSGNRPDFVVKKRIGGGDRVTWERIGVAWQNENGAIFLRFHGTQVLSGGVSLFRENRENGAGA
jgi:hypothetical protein